MKQLSIILIIILTSISVFAQQITSAITITVTGNKNLQINIDEKDYTLANNTSIGNTSNISINNLMLGLHNFRISRTDQNTNMPEGISSAFYLRDRYNMLIKINENSSIELIESKEFGNTDNYPPMSVANFNNIVKNLKNQKSTAAKKSFLVNTFNYTNNHFTTNQARQLIQLISSESNKLQLSKLSYRSITDRSNFYQLFNMLNSQASRNELQDYVNNYNQDNNTNTAMSDANFNSLFNTIKQQWPVNTQMNSLTDAFNNSNNYFSTYQARQLIQLVGDEGNRLQLAKLSYRSITDRNNFSQVYMLFSRQASKDELINYVNNYTQGNNTNNAMSDANFNSLFNTIKQQWPINTQMNSLNDAFNNSNNYFSTYQARQLIQLVSDEGNRLQLAKLSYRSITDNNNFSQVYTLFSRQASKDELINYVNNYNQGYNANNAISDANFNSLFNTIKQQWPVNTQMNSLTEAFNNSNNFFSTYQARQLIQLVSDEGNRLQLAKLSYRNITDRNNFSQVYTLFSSQANKDELINYVNNGNTVINSKIAMSDAEFNTLLQGIQMQFFPGEKMNSLTNAFNVTTNYFSSEQAKKLIPLVTLESNRLQLSKLSYRQIIDRNNFNQLYDLLDSEASRNELQAYVKNYHD